ncbi:MAG: polysaccharide deacetylase family protein [Bacteroidota bacterium]
MKSLVWNLPGSEKNTLYLTFDDGPIPEVTPWVLDQLRLFNVRATFFCVGENAARYPELLERIVNEGHVIGNHTHNHLKGWSTTDREYFRNIIEAGKHIPSRLFRPPYGRIKPSQLKVLRKQYQVIMWSVLTQDYDQKISPERCLDNACTSANGDIVLFHDSVKAQKNLEYALPRFLKYYSEKEFLFKTIPQLL